METDGKLPPKRDVLSFLLEEGWVYLHLDPRIEGVLVPDHLRSQPSLILQIGYDMPVPVSDLDLSEQTLRATLSFSHMPFCCSLPWKAIFAMVAQDGRALLWPSDLPEEILNSDASEVHGGDEKPVPLNGPRRNLQVIPGGLTGSSSGGGVKCPGPDDGADPPTLRLVK